jgi:hypothetical protein
MALWESSLSTFRLDVAVLEENVAKSFLQLVQ